jgi:hypothetical protein
MSNDLMNVGNQFKAISMRVKALSDPAEAWSEVARIVGIDLPQTITSSIHDDSKLVTSQLRRVFDVEPPPRSLGMLYFGLFQGANKAFALYVSGSTSWDSEVALENGELDYLPENRFLASKSLDALSRFERADKDKNLIYSYLVPFGIAAILIRSSFQVMPNAIPIYVGFDAGDYARIRD